MLATPLVFQLAGRFDLQIAHAMSKTEPDWVVYVRGRESVIPLYCAHLLDQAGKSAALIAVVEDQAGMAPKENIYYIGGDPLHDPDVVAQIKRLILPWHQVMVVLEDRPDVWNRLALIQRYAPLVTDGCYLVMDEELGLFAEKQIAFEPDWARVHPGMYLRTKPSGSFDEPSASLSGTSV